MVLVSDCAMPLCCCMHGLARVWCVVNDSQAEAARVWVGVHHKATIVLGMVCVCVCVSVCACVCASGREGGSRGTGRAFGAG